MPTEAWIVVSVIAMLAILGILHTLAINVRNQTAYHEMRLGAARLKMDYIRQLQFERGMTEEPIPVDVLEESASEQDADSPDPSVQAAQDQEAPDAAQAAA